jgi:hypothetical protein
MLTWIKDKIGRVKMHLTRLGEDQPMNKAALVILIFLDIFILVSVFDGLDEHTRQLISPDEYAPYTCREIVIHRNWNDTNRLDNLNDMILSYSTSYYLIDDKKENQHPVCAPFVGPIEKIKNDKELSRLFENRKNFQREAGELESRIKDLKGGYDTSLLETIAKQEEGRPGVSAIKKDIRQRTSLLNALHAQMASLDAKLNQADPVKALWQAIRSLTEADRERLKTDVRTMNFWFPLKRLGMQLLFLLPLFAVFYAWNSASIRKDRHVQTLVSSHLLVVAFIPIFFKIIEAIYDIIPKKLLKKIMDFLVSLNLVAIWHYLIIALSVAIALFLIYIFQKKLFSREKLLEKRIAKGLCQKCGKQLPQGSQACPFCGFVQYKPCKQCNNPTPVYGKHCKECGKPQA